LSVTYGNFVKDNHMLKQHYFMFYYCKYTSAYANCNVCIWTMKHYIETSLNFSKNFVQQLTIWREWLLQLWSS